MGYCQPEKGVAVESNEAKEAREQQRNRQIELARRNAKSARELCWIELKRGGDPAYLANKYEFPVEDLIRAKQQLEARRESNGATSEVPQTASEG